MARKRYTAEEILGKLRQAEVMNGAIAVDYEKAFV
jgi:hypothetical protein